MPSSVSFYNSSSTQHLSLVLVKRSSSYVQLFTRHCYEKETNLIKVVCFTPTGCSAILPFILAKIRALSERVPNKHSKKQ